MSVLDRHMLEGRICLHRTGVGGWRVGEGLSNCSEMNEEEMA